MKTFSYFKTALSFVLGSGNSVALFLALATAQVPYSYSQSRLDDGVSSDGKVNAIAQPHPDLAYPTELSRVNHSSFDELDKIPKREIYRVALKRPIGLGFQLRTGQL